MKIRHLRYFIIAICLIATGCSTTKNIPEGSYLLDNIEIQTDNNVRTSTELISFIRQQPNSSLPILGKVRLKTYNLAGSDSSWVNRTMRNLGETPVLFNPSSAIFSANQLKKELVNLGYHQAEVDTVMRVKRNKVSLDYNIKTGKPYIVRNYTYAAADTAIARIMTRVPLPPMIKSGDRFDMNLLEDERARIGNTIMRNAGYYTFSKEFVFFRADTTDIDHQVDLYMDIHMPKDSTSYPRYKINNVTVLSGVYNMNNRPDSVRRRMALDTVQYRNMTIIRGKNKFLRNSTIARNTLIRKGQNYSDLAFSRTYEAFSSIGAIQQANISFEPEPSDSLRLMNATIMLLPANTHWFQANLDGTNSAGDIGIAPSVSYKHQNLFNGGEVWNITLKGAYEFIMGDNSNSSMLSQNFYEYGAETGITFPQFLFPWIKKEWREQPSAATKISVGLTNQNRPEYQRQFFNASINYNWVSRSRRYAHSLDFIDVNYVRMPWASEEFKEEYLDEEKNPLLSASYKNQLITRTGYSISISNKRNLSSRNPHTYLIKGSFEVAGAVPRLISTINDTKPNDSGSKEFMGVAYAEYLKTTGAYTRTFNNSTKHSLAYHFEFGFAYPYGNSKVLPFERRFFGGGANGVRGWSTRSLGPGAYRPSAGEGANFVNQTGDIKFGASIESRHKISEMIEIAGFVDAGNVWTIHNYENQSGGQFKINDFYKEIGIAYGLGLRFDLGFLLLRLDTGAQAYDPSQKMSERIVIHKPAFSRMAWHFGIGYPF